MLPAAISFLDIETTGTSVTYDRIIEVGIIRVEKNRVVKKYETLINPERTIDDFIINFTGIARQELDSAPTFYQVKDDLRKILEGSIITAHNVRFDYGFLKNEYKRQESEFSFKHLCTVKLARLLYPHFPRFNLDSLIKHLGINCENRHRAMGDTLAIWEFYQKALSEFGEKQLENFINLAMKRPSLPNSLSEKEIERLPENPGVYIFFGESGIPLYVGKSVNIKDRVMSHFSGDYESSKEMKISQQITRIETKKTAGELGALFLESSLIKNLQPLYNRQLRYSRHLLALQKMTDKDGYHTFSLKEIHEIPIEDIGTVAGVFKSKRQATDFLTFIAQEYSLCKKRLGLEKGTRACFSYYLGKCKGACCKKEKAIKYNLRFTEAFAKYRVRPWPFPGPILIHEEGEREEYFLFDKWCFLGSFQTESDFDEIKQEYVFDYDAYKILRRFLGEKKNLKKVKLINNFNNRFPVSLK